MLWKFGQGNVDIDSPSNDSFGNQRVFDLRLGLVWSIAQCCKEGGVDVES